MSSSTWHLVALATWFTALFSPLTVIGATEPTTRAGSVEVTILSSNLASGPTVGEWGFSALVKAADRCVLFDTGFHPDTVLRNPQALDVDLTCVTDVVLSHWHSDHMGGLVTLFEDTRARNTNALKRIHVAEGFFQSRRSAMKPESGELNQMIEIRKHLEAEGVAILIHSDAHEIAPSVWVTGPIERRHEEKNYPTHLQVKEADGSWTTDIVPESQGLVVVTEEGPIVLLGCGHSGSVNLLEQVQREIQNQPIHALMGGMHLFSADDRTLRWTADKLSDVGIEHLMAGHCTGIEPMFRLRNGLGLNRKTADDRYCSH